MSTGKYLLPFSFLTSYLPCMYLFKALSDPRAQPEPPPVTELLETILAYKANTGMEAV